MHCYGKDWQFVLLSLLTFLFDSLLLFMSDFSPGVHVMAIGQT